MIQNLIGSSKSSQIRCLSLGSQSSATQKKRDSSPLNQKCSLLPVALCMHLDVFSVGCQVMEILAVEMSTKISVSFQKSWPGYSRKSIDARFFLCSDTLQFGKKLNTSYMKLYWTKSVDYLEKPGHNFWEVTLLVSTTSWVSSTVAPLYSS